ncbi:MAG TPA: hypothetical protein VHR88_10530 [Solirubrobacteraceae bacterium]|nr:hypothetical protein [Solirubrobacteraceae bacterium]
MLRRIMWFVAGLLALAVLAAAIVPRDTPPALAPTLSEPERTTVKVDIGASPVHPRTIPAHVGDHLLLTVESDRIDTVTIPGLDEVSPVSATTPAQFDTLIGKAGRFDVRMQDANKVVGVLDIKQHGQQ